MSFSPKNWQDSPSTATPISAAALEDLETRLSDYTDSIAAAQVFLVAAPTGIAATDTANIQAQATFAIAAGGGVVQLRTGDYTINGTVTLGRNVTVRGMGRETTTVSTTSTTLYAFSFQTPLTGTADYSGPSFENFWLVAKYGIQINQSGDYATVFSQQANLIGVRFTNVRITGTYPSQTDTDRDTTTVLTPAAGETFGVGIRAAKCFLMEMDNVWVESTGTALYLDGCDISLIHGASRFIGNARHIYIYGHDTFGGGVKVKDCDLLVARREGGVLLEGTQAARIQDNYFEVPGGAGTYIRSTGDFNTQITQNRITDAAPAVAVKLFSFAPQYSLRVENNAFQTGGATFATVELLETNYLVGKILASWKNNGTLPAPAMSKQILRLNSATTVTIPTEDQNVFVIDGTTTIDNITAAGAAREITLVFATSCTVRHFGGGSGNLRLSGAANLSATANDTLTLVYMGPAYFDTWLEKSRTVI